MIKGQDVVVLLSLLDPRDHASVRRIAEDVRLDAAGTHRALHRLAEAGLYDTRRRTVLRQPAEEFLLHAVKYVFPARRGTETRGVPAAWAREPLVSQLADSAALPPVWPHPEGRVRGIGLEPLHAVVPDLALRDEAMAVRLALVDAIRAGDARIRGLAEDALVNELREPR